MLAWLICNQTSVGAENVNTAKRDNVDFARDIRPILERHCYSCHGPDQQEGGLRLDSRAVALRGGDSGQPALVPGNRQASRLWQRIASEEEAERMPPPDAGMLDGSNIELVGRWLDEGGGWPDELAGYVPSTSEHWAFQPPLRPALPPISNPWTRNAIDAFILARLQTQGLQPSAPAERATLLRRLYLDVWGLPPNPDELAEFFADRRPDAYERQVDRLLASPHFGQRMAQYWLDLIRYGDTDGFEVNTPRANAWPYRDYVIEALNKDTPYDQFVREQLCGEQLGVDAATGFLVAAPALLPGQIGQDDDSKRQARQDELDELIVGTSGALLGLTVGCARCHHHKFDPITQQDYYAWQAVFAGVRYGERRWPDRDWPRIEKQLAEIDGRIAAIESRLQTQGLGPPVLARQNRDHFAPVLARFVRFSIARTNRLEPCLDELEIFAADIKDTTDTTNATNATDTAAIETKSLTAVKRNVGLASCGARLTSSGDSTGSPSHKLSHLNDGQYGNERSWMANSSGRSWVQVELPETMLIDEVVWGRDRLGQFQDRLPIDYLVEVAVDPNHWTAVSGSALRNSYSDEAGMATSSSDAESVLLATSADASTHASLSERWELRERRIDLAQAHDRQVYAGQFSTPDTTHVLLRGDIHSQREAIAPNTLSLLGSLDLPLDAPDADRRRSLADWLIRKENPLAARVIVNRIWQMHFGVGIVETASDFGSAGVRPTHPELLDWLACELIDSHWSMKRIHRQILTSQTYRQANVSNPRGVAIDAEARLLWRYPGRRLEAEIIRDMLLAVSGELNLAAGGPGFNLFGSRGGLDGFPPLEQFSADGLRRMIYAHKIRMEKDAVFGAFDCPDAGQCCPKRTQSTTAIQALNLFNSRFAWDRSSAFARRVERDAGPDVGAQVDHAFRLALARPPDAVESGAATDIVKQHGLTTLCRVLFNCNEFLFLP